MPTPSFREDHIAQRPALQLLQRLGYRYLDPEEALRLRGGRTAGVLLTEVLEQQLRRINRIRYRETEYAFSEANIAAGIAALRDAPLHEGLVAANEALYNLLTMGKTLEQTIEGDKKSYNLQYIDWARPENNTWHVTEELAVQRAGSHDTYRPDIVLFVNGIPLVVIECKRPDMKDPIGQAISQHLRNQQEDGIRLLYAYSQVVLSLSVNAAAYATTATSPEYWAAWKEQFDAAADEQKHELALHALKNQDQRAGNTSVITEQDRYLYNLCRPERLLDLSFNYVVYDAGVKKIARYQQYFAIRKTMQRIRRMEHGRRQGGVIWHTQGSGKSLTMVMLAQAIALEPAIRNPKILIVTDRVDLDDQIYRTFQKCQIPVVQARTGKHLVELLEGKSDMVITTIINKFDTAVNRVKKPFESPNVFILVDEGHRSQHGLFNVSMEKTFPNGCFVAFTGTPLMKKEKNTAQKFGGLIDSYPVEQAVADGAVVPLLYEGRHAIQEVNERPIDAYFTMVSEPLNEYQRADLKKKFSRADQLNMADQKIYCIAWDISNHYRELSAGTDWKAQLVCPNKVSAIKYKKYLDEIGRVRSEVLISPPDTREGEDSAYEESSDTVKRFWKARMDEFGGNPQQYEKQLISRFKYDDHPEILVVVDKLLTGFDAPRNTILYITRNLREHTLLQAIARVNRVHPGKDYGFVIDYYGVLKELDSALNTYANLSEFDSEDLAHTAVSMGDELARLPQAHSELWDTFKTLPNKYDEPAYEEVLRDEALRVLFYDRLSRFARLLRVALTNLEWNNTTPEEQQKRYKYDLGFFSKLRLSVKQRFADTIDFKSYEKQIQQLIDKHVSSHEVKPITDLVNIFDKEQFEQEVERVVGTAAKADTIAHRTARHINERMEEDPAFYKRFSELLMETIRAYTERRISEAEYLHRATELEESVLHRTGSDVPGSLQGKEVAQAFFGIALETIRAKSEDEFSAKNIAAEAGLGIDDLIRVLVHDQGTPKVDWHQKTDLIGQIQIGIGDFLIDVVRDKHQIPLTFGEIDEIAEKCIDIARLRYKA